MTTGSSKTGTTSTDSQQQERFREVLRHFDNAMLVTHTTSGGMRARPMALADTEFDGDLWFATSRDSGKIDELSRDARVGVTMQGTGRYLSITGTARIVTDREKIKELWSVGWKAWFKGPDDPSLVLIKVDAHDAEYWDTRGGSGVSFLFKAARAAATGQQPATDDSPDTHGSVHFS